MDMDKRRPSYLVSHVMESIGEKGVQSVDECGLSAHQCYESGHILRYCRVIGKI
jgi:hypothetical protein